MPLNGMAPSFLYTFSKESLVRTRRRQDPRCDKSTAVCKYHESSKFQNTLWYVHDMTSRKIDFSGLAPRLFPSSLARAHTN